MDFGRGSCSREWFNKEEKMTPLTNFPWEPPAESVEADSTHSADANVVKEHMFEKVVTPSDVGKLNRLVIPKQHAEKYFPLDSSTNEKGLVLNFEDRNGKPWRFRYSYWNSSQSYVMTKGWSRFVKEKKLEAGDVVAFQRGVGELGKERQFIDWRRRADGSDRVSLNPHTHHHFPWSQLSLQPSQLMLNPVSRNSFSNIVVNPGGKMGGSVLFFRSVAAPQVVTGTTEWQQQVVEQPVVFDSVPVAQGKVAAKKLRLFGVNMECPISELSTTTVGNARMASQTPHLSSSSQQHPLQLRLYNGIPPVGFLNANKGKSSLSLDFDI